MQCYCNANFRFPNGIPACCSLTADLSSSDKDVMISKIISEYQCQFYEILYFACLKNQIGSVSTNRLVSFACIFLFINGLSTFYIPKGFY